MNDGAKKMNAIERYSLNAGKIIEGNQNQSLSQLKNESKEKLSNMTFPTLKTEEWKYTNLKSLLNSEFKHSTQLEEVVITSNDVDKLKFKNFDNYLLVFVNGVLKKEFSNFEELKNEVFVSTISDAMVEREEIISKYIYKIAVDKTAFDYLNLSSFSDGLFIQIPDNKILDKPIQMLNITGNKGNMTYTPSRNLIIAGKNSETSIVQNYVGIEGEQYFNTIASEIFVDQNALLNIYKVELENEDSCHFDKTDVLQKRDSKFNHFNFTFGGKLVRNDINTELSDENIECTLNGLYIGNDNQHIDNSTFINHAKPHCLSNELYKGILDDHSRGVFNGKILVERDAQLTNAYQNNNTILLSDDATIDTKPQLEIFADDVKCSHGATVGQLDESAMFYILSRGIPREKAKSMLITAFAESVVEGVKIEPLRDELNNLIFEHLNRDKVL
jgi:Fe-S cluster assembly protein SufD